MKVKKNGKRFGFRTMLGVVAVAALTMVGCGTNENAEDTKNTNGAFSNVESEAETKNDILLEEIYQVAINGKAITLPCTVEEFSNTCSEFNFEFALDDARTEYTGGVDIYNAETGAYVGEMFTYYADNSEHSFKEEYVYWLHFEKEDLMVSGTEVILCGGLDFNSTSDEFIEVLGEPTRETELDDCVIYGWDNNPYELMGDDWEWIETSFYFVDGELDEIYIKHETNESRFH